MFPSLDHHFLTTFSIHNSMHQRQHHNSHQHMLCYRHTNYLHNPLVRLENNLYQYSKRLQCNLYLHNLCHHLHMNHHSMSSSILCQLSKLHQDNKRLAGLHNLKMYTKSRFLAIHHHLHHNLFGTFQGIDQHLNNKHLLGLGFHNQDNLNLQHNLKSS